jgi:hypothetical protein
LFEISLYWSIDHVYRCHCSTISTIDLVSPRFYSLPATRVEEQDGLVTSLPVWPHKQKHTDVFKSGDTCLPVFLVLTICLLLLAKEVLGFGYVFLLAMFYVMFYNWSKQGGQRGRVVNNCNLIDLHGGRSTLQGIMTSTEIRFPQSSIFLLVLLLGRAMANII